MRASSASGILHVWRDSISPCRLRRAPRTPRRATRRPTWRCGRAGHRLDAPCRSTHPRVNDPASASNAETPMSGFPAANASPCIVAMPMRSPVNDPGPVATANTSMSRKRHLRSRRAASCRSPGSRAACGSRRRSPARRSDPPSRASAQLPAAWWCRGRGQASGDNSQFPMSMHRCSISRRMRYQHAGRLHDPRT